MATTSTIDELFANIDAMIEVHANAIADHTAQIEALKSARKVLTDNAAPAEVKSTRRRRTAKSTEDEPVKMVTDKQLFWLERKGYDGDTAAEDLTREEASAILDELFNGDADDEAEVEETEARPQRAAKRTRSKRTAKSSNGNGAAKAKSNGKADSDEKQTMKASILMLNEEGMKPRDIAEELDANISYVYMILRESRKSAAK